MPALTNLSFAYPSIPAQVRAGLCSPRWQGEAFVLSTCLRVEIAYPGGPERAGDYLAALYPDRLVEAHPIVRTDADAFAHLCRVAAGLDSPVLGEVEVLGQFRRAAGAIAESGNGAGTMSRVLENAIRIGRSVRRHLDPPAESSLAAVAVELAGPVDRIAVLGSGAMARRAVESAGDGPEVVVYSRRRGVVGGQQTVPWARAMEAFTDAGAVISTVPGERPLFAEPALAEVLKARSEPLRLIDLGMPPGYPGSIRGLADYLDIDDIAARVPAASAPVAEHALAETVASGWQRLSAPDDAGALIASIVEQADQTVEEVVRKFAPRLAETDDPARVLEQAARRVARAVLHSPISFIGTADREAVDLLSRAFEPEE